MGDAPNGQLTSDWRRRRLLTSRVGHPDQEHRDRSPASRDRYIVFYVCAHQQGGLNCSRVPQRPAGVLAGWRPDGSGRAEWRDAGFSPRRKGTDLSLPQPDYPLTLTSLSPGARVSRLYRDG